MENLAELANVLPYDWRGGATDRKGLLALVNTGWVWGKPQGDDGVVFYISMRDYGVQAAIGNRRTQTKSLRRLEEHLPEIVEVVKWGKGRRSTKVLLKVSPDPNHNNHNTPRVSYGSGLTTRKMRGPYYPPKEEIGSHSHDYYAPLTNRLPTRCGQVLDIVGSYGKVASLREIASIMKKDTADGRYKLKKRYLTPLVEEGLLEERDGLYALPTDAKAKFEWYLQKSGCERAEMRQRDANRADRARWENRLKRN